MSAVILSGAKIGKNCLIGANALVTENMEIPDGHLALGSPVNVIKPLGKASQAKVLSTAQGYVENGIRFSEGLKVIG